MFARRVLEAGLPLVETGDGGFAAARPPSGGRVLVEGLGIRLPASAEEPIVFTLPALADAEAAEARVTEIGAKGPAELVGRAVRFEREGGWSFWSVDETGAEEWLLLRSGLAHAEVVVASWQVEGCRVRGEGDFIELVDEQGRVRASVTAPEAVTRSGRLVVPRLDANGDRIELSVDADGEEVLVDPHWVAGGNFLDARSDHAATRLLDGRVLAVGGDGMASAEVYDPVSKHWSPAGSLATSRSLLAAVTLPDGRVLASGGRVNASTLSAANEIFDPATGVWSLVAPLSAARRGHDAALLLDGRVLIGSGYGSPNVDIFDPADDSVSPAAPGFDESGDTLTTLPDGTVLRVGGSGAFRYDPAGDVWTPVAPLGPRRDHSATLLPDGSVLVAGGWESFLVLFDTAHRYDPIADSWSDAGTMSMQRSEHTATLLPSGKVLVVAGVSAWFPTTAAELYDPVTNVWAPTDQLFDEHDGGTATLLADGGVLICGGDHYAGNILDAHDLCELYATDLGAPCTSADECVSGFCTDGVCCDAPCDAACEVCSVAMGATVDGVCAPDGSAVCAATLPIPHWQNISDHPAPDGFASVEQLLDGRLFVAGGDANTPGTHFYDPAANSWTAGPDAPVYQQLSTQRLADGRVLAVSATTVATAVFDPITNAWTATGPMVDNRSAALALLHDGRVIACGGHGGTATNIVEIFDPATGTWSVVAPMGYERALHTATTLSDGRVLVVGGDTSGNTATAEVYDVATDTWTPVAPLPETRERHTATLMPDGRVLVVGGVWHGAVLHDATYFYDPTTDEWTSAGRIEYPRVWHGIVLMNDGRVMISGGATVVMSSFVPMKTVEIYDPAMNGWAVADELIVDHASVDLVTLPSGAVLAVGGSIVERYGTLGQPCGTTECLEGEHCVDGVCCDTPCDAGTCDACSVAAGATSDGVCQLLTGPVCDDGASCTSADQCQSGVCAGTPMACDPPDECHDAACEEGAGCTSSPKPDGTPCSTGLCEGGVCASGTTSASVGTTSSSGGDVQGGGGGDGGGAGGNDTDEPDDGCGCHASGGGAANGAAWLLVALLLRRRISAARATSASSPRRHPREKTSPRAS